MMKGTLAFLMLLQGSPGEEYKAKLAQVLKNTAGKHYSIGEYLSSVQMHQWAREEYSKAVDLDPDHDGARRKLGYKKGESGWEIDPAAKGETANKKKDEDAEKVRKARGDKMESAGRDVAKQFVELALWCKKNSMAEEAKGMFRRALEYDPTHVTARKELGHEKDARGKWITVEEKKRRREMKEGLSVASPGAATSAATATEQALGQTHVKRESDHFVIESVHMDDAQVAILVQHAEHAYAMYHKIFNQQDLFNGGKMSHVILKDKEQHERYVDAFDTLGEAHKELAKKSSGMIGFRSEQYQAARPDAQMQDWVVHTVAQVSSQLLTGGPQHWIHEGTAYYFTRLIKETTATYCVDLAGTGTGGNAKNYQDSENWPIVCKVWVRDGKDPEITAIVKCANLAELDAAETVKAWSLVDFLIAEHRDKFAEMCKALKDAPEIEAALKKAFQWSIADLDARWRLYVKTTY